MTKLTATITALTVKHPWPVIVLSILIVAMCSLGLSRLKIDSDLRVFFSKDNPQLLHLEAMENTYIKNENILFVIAPHDGRVFSRETLKMLKDMTAAAWQTPFSSRVDSITNFQYTYANGDELIVEDLFENIDSMSAADIEKRKTIALEEPMLRDRLISHSADVTSILVNINFIDKKAEQVSAIATYARQLRDEYSRANPDIDFYLTGSVIFDAAFSEVGQHDMTTLVPVMLLVLVCTIGLIFRTVTATLATLLIILMATGTAMGLAGWFGISIMVIALRRIDIGLSVVVSMTLGIVVDDTVHFISKYLGAKNSLGMDKTDAIHHAFATVGPAMWTTTVALVAGFLMLLFSDYRMSADMGLLSAVTITIALFMDFLLLPPLLLITDTDANSD